MNKAGELKNLFLGWLAGWLIARVILTAISDTFIKLTYCHLALLYKLLSKQFLFLNFNLFKSCR